jgi:hypothetical protein
VLDEPSAEDSPPAEVAEHLPEDVVTETSPSDEPHIEEETIENTANDNVEPATSVEDAVIEPTLIVEEGTCPALSKLRL